MADNTTDYINAAALGLAAGDVVGLDSDTAEVVETGLYCPARLPCLGRTGVKVRVDVRLESDPNRRKVAEFRYVYCPDCRTRDAPEVYTDGKLAAAAPTEPTITKVES